MTNTLHNIFAKPNVHYALLLLLMLLNIVVIVVITAAQKTPNLSN